MRYYLTSLLLIWSIGGWTFQLDKDIRKKLGARLLRTLIVHESAVKSQKTSVKSIQKRERIPILVKGNSLKSRIHEAGGSCNTHLAQWATATMTIEEVVHLARFSEVEYIQLANQIQYFNNEAAKHVGVDLVRSGHSPLSQSYSGKNIIIGILDRGIDIKHDDFKNSDGTSRILYLWDQKSKATNQPSGFSYGREWTKTQIDNGQCTHVDSLGHGTNVTGSAAGNGRAVGQHQGMAPNSDFIIVSLKNTSDGVIDGTNYIYTKARSLGKNCVINGSVGWQTGFHDGTSGECQMLDNLILAKNGQVFCSAVGNEGSNPIHLSYPSGFDSIWTYVHANDIRKIMLYARIPNTLQNKVKISIGVDQSNYNPITKSGLPIRFRGATEWVTSKQILNSGWIEEEIKIKNIHYGNVLLIAETPNDSVTGVYIEIQDDDIVWNQTAQTVSNLDLWRLRLWGGNSKIHIWLGGDDYGFSYPNPVNNAHYIHMDTQYSIAIPAVCSNIIGVGASVNRHHWTDINGDTWTSTTPITVGEIASFSSRGPTVDGRIKPDIVAPGLFVISSLSETAASLGKVPAHYIVEGEQHSIASGTSLASPIVAGSIALYLEQNPGATTQQILNSLSSTAKKDSFTGTSLPNSTWGYGKLDIFEMMTQPEIEKTDQIPSYIHLFQNTPNPFNPKTTITYQIPITSKVELNIVNLLGEKVTTLVSEKQPAGNYQIEWNATDFASGLYFYNLQAGNSIKTRKMLLLK